MNLYDLIFAVIKYKEKTYIYFSSQFSSRHFLSQWKNQGIWNLKQLAHDNYSQEEKTGWINMCESLVPCLHDYHSRSLIVNGNGHKGWGSLSWLLYSRKLHGLRPSGPISWMILNSVDLVPDISHQQPFFDAYSANIHSSNTKII